MTTNLNSIKKNLSQKNLLLFEALKKAENIIINDEGYVQYSTNITPEQRENALAIICKSYQILDRVVNDYTTMIELAPKKKSANEFVQETLNDKCPKTDSVTPIYSMNTDEEGYRWDRPFSIDHDENVYESFSSTLVIFNNSDEVVGTFTFTISLLSSDIEFRFQIDLSLVYVRPQFRKGTSGLDLTIGLMKLSTEVFENLLMIHTGKIPIDVVIHADYVSRSGKRLATLVAEEFKDAIFDLKLEGAMKSKIGSLEVEIYD